MHAKREWSNFITTSMLLFALKLAVDKHSNISFNEHGQPPISMLAGLEEEIGILDYNPFGYPLFVLDKKN